MTPWLRNTDLMTIYFITYGKKTKYHPIVTGFLTFVECVIIKIPFCQNDNVYVLNEHFASL